MFSVYGKAGRTFRGTLEELRQVGPITRTARSHVVAPVGMDPQDQNPSRFAELVPLVPTTPQDVAHRTALAAYEQTRNPGLPRHPLTRVDAVMSSAVVTIAHPPRALGPGCCVPALARPARPWRYQQW